MGHSSPDVSLRLQSHEAALAAHRLAVAANRDRGRRQRGSHRGRCAGAARAADGAAGPGRTSGRRKTLYKDRDRTRAGYAAALRVVTAYATIDRQPFDRELYRHHGQGERTALRELIDYAAQSPTASWSQKGFPSAMWRVLDARAGFYVCMLDHPPADQTFGDISVPGSDPMNNLLKVHSNPPSSSPSLARLGPCDCTDVGAAPAHARCRGATLNEGFALQPFCYRLPLVPLGSGTKGHGHRRIGRLRPLKGRMMKCLAIVEGFSPWERRSWRRPWPAPRSRKPRSA